jgi:uncharacterized small protein (DUF1192 family)
MAIFDEDGQRPLKTAKSFEIGQDLSRISVEELELRIAALREEIARVEREIAAKTSQRSAADQLFRR